MDMSIAPPESNTQQFPALRRLMTPSAETTTRIAIRPVFVDDGGKRRRLIVGGGYLVALACLGYIAVVGISLTAWPSGPLDRAPQPLAEQSLPPGGAPAVVVPQAVAPLAPPTVRTENLSRPTTTPTSVRVVATTPARIAPTVAPTAAAPAPRVTTTSPATTTSFPCRPRRGCGSTTTAPTSAPEPTTDAAGDPLDAALGPR
jgi:hypothetical protein